jgi:hypothetical protein
MNAYVENIESSQIYGLMLYLKLLEKQEQTKPQTSRWREIVKVMVKTNELETKYLYDQWIKRWFFEKCK